MPVRSRRIVSSIGCGANYRANSDFILRLTTNEREYFNGGRARESPVYAKSSGAAGANRGESIAVSRIVCFKSGCVQIAATAAEQSLSFDLKHPVPTAAYSHSR